MSPITPFITQQVNKFYDYMATVFLEYNQLPEKPVIKIAVKPVPAKSATSNTSHEEPAAPTSVANESVMESVNESESEAKVEETRVQSFAEYFLYKLYYNYGIKRRMVNTDIALLFYAKNLRGYKPTEWITMLCRHMMLDMRNMRVISLGVTKAMKLEDFCTMHDIKLDDASTNLISDASDRGASKFSMFKFPEGTMMTYNPSLSKYHVEIAVASNGGGDDDEEADEDAKESVKHQAEIEANIQQQFARQFPQKCAEQMQYSTRKVVGTGRFSSLKTFMEMFNENNAIGHANIENIPDEVISNKVLIFNIEHPENRVVSNNVRNYNTLCAVYQLKSDVICTDQFSKIVSLLGEKPLDENLIDEWRNRMISAFAELGHDMIHAVDINQFAEEVAVMGVRLNVPECIKSFGNTKSASASGESVTIDKLSMSQLVNIVHSRPKDFQGYILYGINGSRTKIMNPKYKELRTLKGNKPIVIEQWNTKNLFYLYWRLVKLQMIPQFITEFDTTGGWSYNQLFYWFATLARGYAINLFRVYHTSFVKKTMDKYNIPYSMKPMCGDLHTMYKTNKMPISQSMVETLFFVFFTSNYFIKYRDQ